MMPSRLAARARALEAVFVVGCARAARALPPIRGRGRLALAWQRTRVLPAADWTFEMRGGHRMRAPNTSAQTWRAAFTGTYDDEEVALLVRHLRPNTFVLDVGASLGFYTVPLARGGGPSGCRVLAVEPVANNCETIRHNVRINGVSPFVHVAPVALGERRQRVVLRSEAGGTGNAAVVSDLDPGELATHARPGVPHAVVEADVVPLDLLPLPDACHDLPCSVMKLDVEGFELAVLAGASNFVERHRPVILGEFHPQWLHSRGVPPDGPQRWATEHGYRCHELVYTRDHPLSERKRVSVRLLDGGARSGTSLLLLPGDGEEVKSLKSDTSPHYRYSP